MRWVEGDVVSPAPRNARGRTSVNGLIADGTVALAVSEQTLVEFFDALARDWRNGNSPECDQTWAERSSRALLELVAAGRIQVIDVPKKAVEHAIFLMKMATEDFQLALKAGDAVHLITATRWADDLGAPVELATSDNDFSNFLAKYSHFGAFVSLLDVCA